MTHDIQCIHQKAIEAAHNFKKAETLLLKILKPGAIPACRWGSMAIAEDVSAVGRQETLNCG